jgi:hypothetical protein
MTGLHVIKAHAYGNDFVCAFGTPTQVRTCRHWRAQSAIVITASELTGCCCTHFAIAAPR